MASEFDIGPLTWVKDEIDKALDESNRLLSTFSEQQDVTQIKHAKTQLYQATGALDMVGLEGCQYFCNALEVYLTRIEQDASCASESVMTALSQALLALKQYLNALMQGSEDAPMRLMPQLTAVATAMGETISPLVLFLPETAISLPRGLQTIELSEADYQAFVAKQRVQYQKAFLLWLQKNATALATMLDAVRNICHAQTRMATKTLWWAMSGFIDALADDALANMPEVKRYCRRLDQELKLAADGNKPSPDLLKEALYYVAISSHQSPLLTEIREAFSLARYMNSEVAEDAQSSLTVDESAQLADFADAFKERWAEISNQLDLVAMQSSSQQVHADSVLLTQCVEWLEQSQTKLDAILSSPLKRLTASLAKAMHHLIDEAGVTTHAVLIELATGIHLFGDLVKADSAQLVDVEQKIELQINILNSIVAGEAYAQLDVHRSESLESDTLKAVVVHVLDLLKKAEQSLDTFFRAPQDKTPLAQVIQPVKTIAAVYEMLNYAVPAEIADICLKWIYHFASSKFTEDQGEFQLVAENLSMLGLLAEGLPKSIQDYAQQLQDARDRLYLLYTQAVQDQTTQPLAKSWSHEVNHAQDQVTVLDKAMDDELLDIFLTEAEEVLASIAQHVNTLKLNPDNHEVMVELRRCFHTLKGSGRTVGLSHLGDLAGQVEFFLNPLLDRKALLSAGQLEAISGFSGQFANWVNALREQQQVDVALETWKAKIAEWSANAGSIANENDSATQTTTPKQQDIVLIDGLRPISRQFYQIFLNESTLHITALEQDLASIESTSSAQPADKSKHACHTLGSNALAAGFTHMGDLCRALESWLDETATSWQNDSHLTLFHDTVHALAKMWQAVSQQHEPQAMPALLERLSTTQAIPESDTPITTEEMSQASIKVNETPLVLDVAPSFTLGQINVQAAPVTGKIDFHSVVDEIVLGLSRDAFILEAPTLADSSTDSSLEEDTSPKIQSIEIETLAPEATEAEPSVFDTQTFETIVIESPVDNVSETAHPVYEETHFEIEAVDASSEIVALFNEEAEELIPKIGLALRQWQQAPDEMGEASEIQRDLHTLKGSARMAGYTEAANTLHRMEDAVEHSAKKGVTPTLFDSLLAQLDTVSQLVDLGEEARQQITQPISKTTSEKQRQPNDLSAEIMALEQALSSDALTSSLEAPVLIAHGGADAAKPAVIETPSTERRRATDPVIESIAEAMTPNKTAFTEKRLSTYLRLRPEVLDRLINEAGEVSILRSRIDKELIGLKHASHELTENITRMRQYLRELEIEADSQLQSRLTVLQEANQTFDPLEFDRFTRLQELTRMLAESVGDIGTIQQTFAVNMGQAEAALQQQTRMNRDLQQSLMQVRMLPFAQLSERLHRVVRQTARDLNKRVELHIDGEKTDIDRSVLEKIGAPLEHILRNAIAHGIETKDARKLLNKSEVGHIHLRVKAQNDEIFISIKDDGAGVDVKKVKQIGLKQGLIKKDAKLTDTQLMALIFETGFSTAEQVDQIAGRGVGLDVVRTEVTALGGRIDLESQPHQGATFSIHLPVTLSVAQVLTVSSAEQTFLLPVTMIDQAQKLKLEQLQQAEAKGMIEWGEEAYPLHDLRRLLNQPLKTHQEAYVSVLLLRSGQYRLAVSVDEVVGNQEVVIKPIGPQIARVPGIVGATVTGEGYVQYIINPILLANREHLSVGTIHTEVIAPVIKKPCVLVVDDSLTMRKVLGRLMEREGFEVLLAKDGMDAIQQLKERVPDVVLSDIEMPRMDGFGLARNIRDDALTSSVPIIMISSRTADKHQHLAREIGVNAFFGKPVQEDALVEKVRELLAK